MSETPVISDLPPAPSRNDGPADFTPKADAMIGALQPMVVQLNASFSWVGSQVAEINAIRAAAGLPPALATLHALALSF